MADLDDDPANFSELDLSEDAAIDGEDIQSTLAVDEPSEVTANSDTEEAGDDATPESESEAVS